MSATPPAASAERDHRRRTGAWYTPPHLVELLITRTLTPDWVAAGDRPLRVLDPACGDGRFLAAAARAVRALGGEVELTAVDIDRRALDALDADHTLAGADRRCVDALTYDWGEERFDLVIGNPPFLSPLSAATRPSGPGRRGGGPYADTAAEFLALAVRLADPNGGRLAFVLPQSILAARDAAEVRALVDRTAHRLWSWWSPDRHFDAEVVVCAIGFERRPGGPGGGAHSGANVGGDGSSAVMRSWNGVVLDALGIPQLPPLRTTGCLGDRATLNANFRDEYYALTAAVTAEGDGPPLVTSGLIDPGRCWWGERPVRFAKQDHEAPRIDLERLDARMRRWADRKLVPKVLIANQTRIIEAVTDPTGAWLPGVPVTTAIPAASTDPGEIAAVLTSAVASAWAWAEAAGTGRSARAIRLGPAMLAHLPWPAGELTGAVGALRQGEVERCGDAVLQAYGLDPTRPDGARLTDWWSSELHRLGCSGDGVRRAPATSDRVGSRPARSGDGGSRR